MTAILLLGAGGQLGVELARILGPGVTALTRAEVDLVDADAVRARVRSVHPRWIVNAAAYTAVDRAEKEPELAFAINGIAVGALAEEAARVGAAVIHVSTDYVFDGACTRPRRESDAPAPLGVYGASKLAGEQALAASGAAYFLFRTSWVYSSHGSNFMLTMLRLAGERAELRVVADQRGSPTAAPDLAAAIHHAMQVAEELAARERLTLVEAVRRIGGLYHVSNAGETSWFGFAEEILRLARLLDPDRSLARLIPITTAEYPTPARRPSDSRLDCTRLGERLGFTMPEWKASLAKVMEACFKEQGIPAAPVLPHGLHPRV